MQLRQILYTVIASQNKVRPEWASDRESLFKMIHNFNPTHEMTERWEEGETVYISLYLCTVQFHLFLVLYTID